MSKTTENLKAEGYYQWEAGIDPYEEHLGAFLMRPDEAGGYECACATQPFHANGGGMLHGGFLMSFADFALFAFAADSLKTGYAVTVGFSSEFLSAAKPGSVIEAHGSVTRETGSMIFARGMISAEGKPVMSFSGIMKKLGSAKK